MILEQYYIERLSHSSYLIGDEASRRAIVVDPRRDIADYLADADRYGLTIIGYLTIDRDGVFPAELADLLRSARRVTVDELRESLDKVTLIDVRNPAERELGAIPGSHHIPLAQLRIHLDVVPADKPIVVHCAGGWRSSVAASLLRAKGFDDASDLAGGYHAWAQANALA